VRVCQINFREKGVWKSLEVKQNREYDGDIVITTANRLAQDGCTAIEWFEISDDLELA
jgi:hypothetical protein